MMPPRLKLAGKAALVTGAASGIGLATSELLAREGARLLVTDLDAEAAEGAAWKIRSSGGLARSCPLDVTQEPDWEQAIEIALSEWGVLDILVNNAGLSHAAPLTEISLDDWRRVMSVNLEGVFLGLKHGIRALRAGRGGSIVNVSSASGVKAAPGASAYCASKAAVRMLAKTAALECAAAGDPIRINTVLPAGVRTPMWDSMDFFQNLAREKGGEEAAWQALAADSPAKRFATPDEVAQAILFLASDEASYINGAEIAVDYGYTA